MKPRISGLLSVALMTLSACQNSAQVVSPPAEITLERALQDIANGLGHMKQTIEQDKNDPQKQNPLVGSLVDEVDINFQLAATGNSQYGSNLTVGTPTGAPIAASLGVSFQNAQTGSRGSTIQIKIRNAGTAPLNYVGCYYYIHSDKADVKNCAGKSSDAGGGGKGAGGGAMNDVHGAVAKYAADRLQQDLGEHSGFVVTDARIR
jgi:hypothetical protein